MPLQRGQHLARVGITELDGRVARRGHDLCPVGDERQAPDLSTVRLDRREQRSRADLPDKYGAIVEGGCNPCRV